MSLAPGAVIGHYRIEATLGSGGNGVVYRAHDLALDRTVALKLLHATGTDAEEENRRLLREAKAAAALGHPNICVVLEVGDHGGELARRRGNASRRLRARPAARRRGGAVSAPARRGIFECAILLELGDRAAANGCAAETQEQQFAHRRIAQSYTRLAGLPFDVTATPDFAALVQRHGLILRPYQPMSAVAKAMLAAEPLR